MIYLPFWQAFLFALFALIQIHSRIEMLRNVRARHRDGIVIEHSGYQLHIITDIPPDTVVSELTRLFLDVFADPN